MKKKLLIILTLMISIIMLTSCNLIGKIYFDLTSEKPSQLTEGTFESDDVVHIAKNFVLEKEDGTTKEYGDITITKTKLVITKTDEFKTDSDILRNGDYGYYKVEIYFQINNSDYFECVLKDNSSLARAANKYCFEVYFDEYFGDEILIREYYLIYEPEKSYQLETLRKPNMLYSYGLICHNDYTEEEMKEKENIVFTINRNEIGEENE